MSARPIHSADVPPRFRRTVILLGLGIIATAWAIWLASSGALAKEAQFRRGQLTKTVAGSRPPYATIVLASTGTKPELDLAPFVTDQASFGDSSLILIATPNAAALAQSIDYMKRLIAHYDLPVRLVTRLTVGSELRPLARRLGFPDRSAIFAVIKGSDSVAFRTERLLALDEQRELLSTLYRTKDRLRPMVSESPADWNHAFSASRFRIGDDTVRGLELFRGASRAVVLAAECSACRIKQHLLRLRAAGLDTMDAALVVASHRYAAMLKDSLPGVRLAEPIDELRVIDALSLVSRDVTAADPVLLSVTRGVVSGVSRLRASPGVAR